MRTKKAVHYMLLPASICNDWPARLADAGLTLGRIGRFRPGPEQPPGFDRISTGVQEGSASVSLSSRWDPVRRAYELGMLILLVERDLPLAVKVEDVLIRAGAVPLTNELERLQDMVAGRPPRQLVEATEWPRAGGQ